MIRIVTDTSSDITQLEAAVMGITLLTLPVSFSETPYDQMKDDKFIKFYELLEHSKTLPVTSQSSIGEFLKIFEEAKTNGDGVVVIPISSGLSGSWQSANAAKDIAGYEDIHIIDARQTIMGQRLLTEYAVKLRNDGMSAQKIAECVTEVSGRICLYGTLNTLRYLIMGGRISKSTGAVGSALGIKPVVSLQNGLVTMVGKAKGRSNALSMLTGYIRENSNFDKDFPFIFGYTKDSEPLEDYMRTVKAEFDLPETIVCPVGSVVGTHIGPGAIIIAWVAKKKA